MKHLINLFYPKVCLGCSDLVTDLEGLLCLRCRHELPLTNHYLEKENEFFKRFFGRLDLEFAASMVYFHKKGIVQELMHHLKYRNCPEIGTFLGEWYGEILKEHHCFHEATCVVPVPIHPKKLRERGYNQVENFAKTLANKLNKDYDENLLERKKYSRTQVFKNLVGRSDVIDDVFGLNEQGNIRPEHFLLVDDLVTTGSTLESCAKSLLSIPNSKVSLATIGFAH